MEPLVTRKAFSPPLPFSIESVTGICDEQDSSDEVATPTYKIPYLDPVSNLDSNSLSIKPTASPRLVSNPIHALRPISSIDTSIQTMRAVIPPALAGVTTKTSATLQSLRITGMPIDNFTCLTPTGTIQKIFIDHYPKYQTNFWEVIWYYKIDVGVQLSKDYGFIPEVPVIDYFGSIRITNLSKIIFNGITVTRYELRTTFRGQDVKRTYAHLLMNWPYFGLPSKEIFQQFIRSIFHALGNNFSKGNIYIPCLARRSRVGIFVLTWLLMQRPQRPIQEILRYLQEADYRLITEGYQIDFALENGRSLFRERLVAMHVHTPIDGTIMVTPASRQTRRYLLPSHSKLDYSKASPERFSSTLSPFRLHSSPTTSTTASSPHDVFIEHKPRSLFKRMSDCTMLSWLPSGGK